MDKNIEEVITCVNRIEIKESEGEGEGNQIISNSLEEKLNQNLLTKKINYKGKIKEIPICNPNPALCEDFIISRMRYCKFEKLKNCEFCIYHIPDENKELLVDCPLDSSHRVLINKLKKHLKICNKLQEKLKLTNNEWYSEKINKVDLTPFGIDQTALNEFYELKWEEITEEEYSNTMDKIVKCYEILREDYSEYSKKENLTQDIKSKEDLKNEKIILNKNETGLDNSCIISDCSPVNDFIVSLSGLEIDNLKDLNSTKNLVKSEKNGKQNAALGNILEQYNLMDLKNVYIEFGAGRGGLSDYIGKMLDHKSIHILLEREVVRYKKDRFYENMIRFRTDILDFDVNYLDRYFKQNPQIKIQSEDKEDVPFNQIDFNLIGVAKHICGCAFDLSLACIMNYAKSDNVKAISMATCCHHLCRVEYLNNFKFYNEYLNLSVREIVLLFKATSWIFGPINVENKEEIKDTQENLKTNDIFLKKGLSKKYVGLVAKYVVDLSRVFFLISKNFKVYYLKYCDNEITTENNLILAIKN